MIFSPLLNVLIYAKIKENPRGLSPQGLKGDCLKVVTLEFDVSFLAFDDFVNCCCVVLFWEVTFHKTEIF